MTERGKGNVRLLILNGRTFGNPPAGPCESFTSMPSARWPPGWTSTTTTTSAYLPLNRLLSRTPDVSFTGAVPESFTYTATGNRGQTEHFLIF